MNTHRLYAYGLCDALNSQTGAEGQGCRGCHSAEQDDVRSCGTAGLRAREWEDEPTGSSDET